MTQTTMDTLFIALDEALRTIFAEPLKVMPCPTLPYQPSELSSTETRIAGALMRVNHVGEVCAQALYAGQAVATESESLRRHFKKAGQEETNHLAWTKQRLDELGARPSLLNPLWYAGAFGLGLVAGKLGDRLSLGFVVETEKQVEAHLASHLERLPTSDHASRAIVAQMKADEASHALEAERLGAIDLPDPLKDLMRGAAKVMTMVAHRL